jgi:hypothetical protein
MRALEVRSHLLQKAEPMMGVDPTTAVSTAPIAGLFNEVDRTISDLVGKMNSLTHLLDDQRSAGVQEQALVGLQMDMKQLEMAVLSIKEPLSMIKAKHASVVQMQPLGPVSGGMAPDPMGASMQQQMPQNMPADMAGGAQAGGF